MLGLMWNNMIVQYDQMFEKIDNERNNKALLQSSVIKNRLSSEQPVVNDYFSNFARMHNYIV